LEWAARNVRLGRSQFDRAFSVVNYDRRRAERGIFHWPHGRYLLGNIELWGGICTDQAYFATIAGKARGIPTLYFAGQGTDGGHAWFGYLRGPDRWELDAGRYVNQNYTVGQALDPQTWLPITDHELLYFSGRTARQPKLDAALGDLVMAEVFARRGDEEQRLAAADSALHQAPELVAAWEIKEEVLEELGDSESLRTHYAKAADHFRRQNDLRVRYQARLADLASGGGEEAVARRLRDRMIRDNRRERADLSSSAAAAALVRLVDEGDFDRAMREYRTMTRQIGRQGGGNYFYEVVRPFVRQLRAVGRDREAGRALQLARREMGFASDSILEREFQRLEEASQ
jgi:tetratricopeptide (TPR) repeat protein